MGFYEIEQRKIDKQVIIKIMGSTGHPRWALLNIQHYCVLCSSFHNYDASCTYDTVVGFLKLLSHLNILLLKKISTPLSSVDRTVNILLVVRRYFNISLNSSHFSLSVSFKQF